VAVGNKARWSTRLGFYLAAVGSAFGLGNLWRFPYIVAENGGGAFVLLYLFLVFVVGMPFLIGELILGKATGSNVIPAMDKLRRSQPNLAAVDERQSQGRIYAFFTGWGGRLALFLCVVVLAYYSVISGWVLHFLMQFLVGLFRENGVDADMALEALMTKGWLQIMLAGVHLLLVMVIVVKDVEDGIERWVGRMMPLFMVLLFVLAVRSLSTDSAYPALRFYLYPDFTRLSMGSFAQAIGHVFFTLSVGFGTIVTFGSYMNEKMNVPLAGFRVAVIDSIISLFAGILIFPLVFGSSESVVGPGLLFQTVPKLLSQMSGGVVYGIGFFLCLYLAALGASIGLLETAVANLREAKKVPRARGARVIVVVALLFAVVPALSSSVLSGYRFGGRSVLGMLDAQLVNVMLPIVALIISQVIVYRVDQQVQKAEFHDDPTLPLNKLYSHWRFAMRWLAPALILSALVLQLF